MPATKTSTAHLAAVTTGTTSTAQDISTAYLAEMAVSIQENGTRTVASTLQLQFSEDGTNYFNGALFTGPLTSTTISNTLAIPTTASKVKITFTPGTGGTSTTSTGTATCGLVTAI